MATINNEMKCYFEKLIEPLVTDKALEDLVNKLKGDLMKKFDEKISSKMLKLKNLNPSYQFMKTQLISDW